MQMNTPVRDTTHNTSVTGLLVKWKFYVALLLTVCLQLGLSPFTPGAESYSVHVVEPAVTDHLILPEGPLPLVCKQASAITLRACRGEYEPASFVVTASKPLEGVRIEVGPVSGPGGQWPKEAVDVRVVKDYYRGTLAGGAAAMPTLLVHDDTFLAIEPDPTEAEPHRMKNVATGPLQDTAELRPVMIQRRKQFWITVHVPVDAAAGSYSTKVRIIPGNSDASELTLNVEVYPFDLLAPMKEYCMYYPVYLGRNLPRDNPSSFADRTEQQYLAELRNMLAHGLANPDICEGPVVAKDGTLDFAPLARVLDLRESVGMRPKALYLSNMSSGIGHPILFRPDRPLTPVEREQIQTQVRQINTWVRARGYDETYFMAVDEQWGEKLLQERDTMSAITAAGGKVFVAVMSPDFFDSVGDVLQRPVLLSLIGADLGAKVKSLKCSPQESLRHMAEIGKAGSFERLNRPGFRTAVDSVHRLGNKIFTYMNPTAGVPLPELQRRNEGLGLWRVGLDGTMTWAYVNLQGDWVNQPVEYAKVFHTLDGVVDTLHWEGFREGVDDVRYLTTLMTILNDCVGRFPRNDLVLQSYAWLHEVDIAQGDLDDIRREMARRIIALLDLGYKELPPEQALAGIDRDKVRIIVFPEPWRFKLVPVASATLQGTNPPDADQGTTEKWFDTATDDSQWGPMRTDTKEKGWGQETGFGWYRTRLPLTAQDAQRKYKYLYFGACDEDARVYINGQQVFEHSVQTTGLLPEQIWLVPFVVPLKDVTLRGNDLLAVRVVNTEGMGGIWKPVRLVLSDQELTTQQVKALVELKTLVLPGTSKEKR